jgi:hypothetical protein
MRRPAGISAGWRIEIKELKERATYRFSRPPPVRARTGGGVASGGAAMLTGMTAPPSGRDKDKARERRLQRSGEAGGGTDEAIERDDKAEARSPESHEGEQAVNDDMETEHGSTSEQVRRAAQLEARSYRHVQRAKHEATEAHDRAADAHGRAAQLHDRQADLGWGNVDEHREQAHEHREYEEADRAAADNDRDEDHGDGSDQPTPPVGPYTGWPPRR